MFCEGFAGGKRAVVTQDGVLVIVRGSGGGNEWGEWKGVTVSWRWG